MDSGSSMKPAARLEWPEELAGSGTELLRWEQPGSNISLDYHGDPVKAELVVYSDGNHHMALGEALDVFARQKGPAHIFYATTPPGPIVTILREGGLRLGNLIISLKPHVFIGPPGVLDKLIADGFMDGRAPFVKNQGNVLLVKKGNPGQIHTVADLARDEVRLFLSNPDTEKASYQAYYNTLKAISDQDPAAKGFLEDKVARGRVVFGSLIHHREAPRAVADGSADAAMVFYHLALRYTRIFPGVFEIIPLGGSPERPDPVPGNVVGRTYIGLVGDGGAWGRSLLDFLASDQVSEIYKYHGLLPAAE